MGYSVSEPSKRVLHWLYVKRDYRGMGVGTQLLEATCPPYSGASGERGHSPGWRYTYRTKASTRFLGEGFIWDPVPARVKA